VTTRPAAPDPDDDTYPPSATPGTITITRGQLLAVLADRNLITLGAGDGSAVWDALAAGDRYWLGDAADGQGNATSTRVVATGGAREGQHGDDFGKATPARNLVRWDSGHVGRYLRADLAPVVPVGATVALTVTRPRLAGQAGPAAPDSP
jgi:hypothetical protein